MKENEVVNLKAQDTGADATEEEEWDLTPFWSYLKTPQGHEVAQRVIGIIEDIKKLSLERNSSHKSWDTVAKYSIIAAVVVAVGLLSYFEKLDPTTGMLFGTIVGYFFGKKEEK